MPLVLAVEPDPRQSATLRRVVKGQVRADLVVVDSKDAALAAIATRVPDLILVTALLAPRDEDDLTQHLKTLEHATHLQTLTIPLLASAPVEEHLGSRMFGAFRRKRKAAPIDGCDPRVFGEQIEGYLQRAAELQAEERAREDTQRRQRQDTAQANVAPDVNPLEPAIVESDLSPAANVEQDLGSGADVEQDFSPAVAETEEILPTAFTYSAPALEQDLSPATAEQPAADVEQDLSPAADVEQDFSPVVAETEEILPTAFTYSAPALEQDLSPATAEQPAADVEQDLSPAADVEQDFSPAFAAQSVTGQDIAPASMIDVAGDGSALTPDDVSRKPVAETPTGFEVESERGTEAAGEPAGQSSFMRDTSAAVHTAWLRALTPLHAFVAHVASGLKTGRSVATQRPDGSDVAIDHDGTTAAPVLETGQAAAQPGPAPEPLGLEASTAPPVLRGTSVGADADEDWQDLTPMIAPAANSPAAADTVVPAEEDKPASSDEAGPGLGDRLKTGDAGARTGEAESTPPTSETDARSERKSRRRRRARRRPVIEIEAPLGLDGHFIATALAALRTDIERLRQDAFSGGATVAAEPCETDEARNGNGANGNGHGRTYVPEPSPAAEPAEPVQDEWGFYDPGRCGMQALMARLDAQEGGSQDQAAPRKTSAMQQLIAGGAGAAPPAGSPPRTAHARQAAPTSDDVEVQARRLAPLAIWAHAGQTIEYDTEQVLHVEPIAHLPGLIASLRVPDHVAAVRYGSGCRIRRIRVAPGPKHARSATRQVLILSKKALKDLR